MYLPVDFPLNAGNVEEHIHPGQVGGHGEGGQLDYLPVDFPLYAGNVEEHIHPGQVGGHGEGGELLLVLYVDGSPALHRHVEHCPTRV